jgi:hypothetical protein
MVQRCYNHNHTHYKRYGGRGIKICDEWRNDFMSFYTWAVNNGYNEYLTIDRIDNDKSYSPENCRWITIKEQQNNRGNNRSLTLNGETKTLAQWSKIVEIPLSVLRRRFTEGWSDERILTQKLRPIILEQEYKKMKRSKTLIKHLLKIAEDATTSSTPKQLWKHLFSEAVTKDQLKLLLAFQLDMIASAIALGLLPPDVTDKVVAIIKDDFTHVITKEKK